MTGIEISMTRSEQLARMLACPNCRSALDRELECLRCGVTGRWDRDRPRFGGFSEAELRRDPLNRTKDLLKHRLVRLYPLAIEVLAPVHNSRFVPRFLASFDLDGEMVADLGCGTYRYDPRVICVDGAAYDNVDLITDLRRLPLLDDSLAGILSVAVLEHVPDPEAHIAEMRRVLKPGGRLLCYVPFMQPFHASPCDFQRYTAPGLSHRFRDFDIIDVRVGAGPTSGLVWVLQEWLALVLSLGSARLYRAIHPLMSVLSPLKYLDRILSRHPAASIIASGFLIEARKPVN